MSCAMPVLHTKVIELSGIQFLHTGKWYFLYIIVLFDTGVLPSGHLQQPIDLCLFDGVRLARYRL